MFPVIQPEIINIKLADFRKPDAKILDGTCLVFRTDALEEMANLKTLMSREEIERSNKFRFKRDRETYAAAHSILRLSLSKFEGLSPDKLEFTTGPYGKPRIAYAGGVHFNLSHAQNKIAIGFSRGSDIGIDIESVNPDIDTEQIGNRVYGPDEKRYIAAGESMSADRFYQLWTRKEALIKRAGFGLSTPIDLRNINVLNRVPAIINETNAIPAWCSTTILETYKIPGCGILSVASAKPGTVWNIYQLQ